MVNASCLMCLDFVAKGADLLLLANPTMSGLGDKIFHPLKFSFADLETVGKSCTQY